MPALRTLDFWLAALAAVPVLATRGSFDNCTPLSYDEFEGTRRGDEVPLIGPKGIYAYTTGGDCLYIDASINGAFAKDYTSKYQSFMEIVSYFQSKDPQIADLEFLSNPTVLSISHVTPRNANAVSQNAAKEVLHTLENRQAACNQICSSSQGESVSCLQCKCKFAYSFCVNLLCTSFYKCL